MHRLAARQPNRGRPVVWLVAGPTAVGQVSNSRRRPRGGKILVTLDLCARLSIGQPLPDGSLGRGPGNSIVLEGEDNGNDTQ